MGLACENSGEAEKALKLFEKSLEIRRINLGDDHQDLVPSLSNLVAAYMCSDQVSIHKIYPCLDKSAYLSI